MPVYPKGPSRWHVVIHFRGRRVDRELDGSKADAEAYEARLRVNLEAGQKPEIRAIPTFSSFCVDRYKPHAQANLRPRVWKNRTYQIRTLCDFFHDARLNEIGPIEAMKFRDARLLKKIKPSTINDDIKILKAILHYAELEGYPVQNLETLGKLREPNRRVFFWNEEEVDRLLAASWLEREHTQALYGMILFLLNTGCRKGEAVALPWVDVDMRNRLITIQPNDEWQPKDNDAREVPISDPLYAFFETAPKKSPFVFTSRKGEPYAKWPQRAFDRARKAAGLLGGPHACRHTFSAHFLKETADLTLLAEILGDGEDVVRRHYRHLLPEHMDRARNAVRFGSSGTMQNVVDINEGRKRKDAL